MVEWSTRYHELYLPSLKKKKTNCTSRNPALPNSPILRSSMHAAQSCSALQHRWARQNDAIIRCGDMLLDEGVLRCQEL